MSDLAPRSWLTDFSHRYLEMAQERPPHPKIFISSWLDYAHKYGMGYALTDGTVGVHFNDSSTMVFAPSKQYVRRILSTRILLIPSPAGISTTSNLPHQALLLKHYGRITA